MPHPIPTALVTSMLTAGLFAQCPPTAVPGPGIPGTNDLVRAQQLWDPDGPGPAPEQLVVGGTFRHAGTGSHHLIALVDPLTGVWSSLANTELTGTEVRDLTVAPNGDLIVVGTFGVQGQPQVQNAARFDGTTWTPMGQLLPYISAVAALPNGDILAGGTFQLSGPPSDSTIARWDGTAWSSFGQCSGAATTIDELFVTSTGDVVVGGFFSSVDGVAANNIARWDGSSWNAFGSGANNGANNKVFAVAENANGELLVGGQFQSFAGVPAGLLVQQNGNSWTALFPPPPIAPTGVTAIASLPGGGVAAVGGVGTFAGRSFGIYDGASWSYPGTLLQAGGSPASMLALTRLPDGSLCLGGRLHDADGEACANITRYEPQSGTWSRLGDGTNGRVRALLRTSNGELYAGGDFTYIDGVPARYLARLGPNGWQPVLPAPTGSVAALSEAANGDLIAGGSFLGVGNIAANRIARFDGSSWQAMGAGSTLEVRRVVTGPNGDVIAVGSFTGGFSGPTTARWNGSTWLPFGEGEIVAGSNATITQTHDAVGLLANGDFVVAAYTANPTDHTVLRWDGNTWSDYAPGALGYATRLVVLPDDRLLLGSNYWDGSSWQASGLDAATAGARRADGQAWVATRRNDGTSFVAAGSGGAWSTLVEGSGVIESFVANPDGSLWVAGAVLDLGGVGGGYLARIETPCPASVTAAGPGCLSSIGPVQQQVSQAAWTGATASARAAALPNGSLALHTIGFTAQALPLGNVLPQAGAGCTLWHTADLIVTPTVVSGPVTFAVPIPPTAALAGSDYRTQIALLELDALGAIHAIATSNALRWTIGSFD